MGNELLKIQFKNLACGSGKPHAFFIFNEELHGELNGRIRGLTE